MKNTLIIRSAKNHGADQANHQHRTAKPNIHSAKLMLCIWRDQLGVVYYELLQPNETITGERFQQLMQLSQALKQKQPYYVKRHDKVIFQNDNARPHVAKPIKETLEALNWNVLSYRHILQILLFPIIIYFDR